MAHQKAILALIHLLQGKIVHYMYLKAVQNVKLTKVTKGITLFLPFKSIKSDSNIDDILVSV